MSGAVEDARRATAATDRRLSYQARLHPLAAGTAFHSSIANTFRDLNVTPVYPQLAELISELNVSPLQSQFADTFLELSVTPVYPQLAELISELNLPAIDVLSQTVDEFNLPPLGSQMADVMNVGLAAAIGTQRVLVDAGRVAGLGDEMWTRLLADAMAPINSTVADVTAITRATLEPARSRLLHVAQLAASSAELVAAHHDALGALIGNLSTTVGEEVLASGTRLGLASQATSDYVAGARSIVEDRRGTPVLPTRFDDEPARVLAIVDERLVGIRAGAWNAVETGGPDWQRHAAHGGRELLRQFVEVLAPDEAVESRFDKVNRRNRVRFVVEPVSGTESSFAAALEESVITALDLLSAEAKSAGPPRFGLVGATGILMSLDGLIVLLGSIRERK